jgi:hypothetical protein
VLQRVWAKLIRLVHGKPSIPLEKLDQILGLRSWGLILYGALPASLSLLGLLEIKVEQVKVRSATILVAVLLISLLPILVTFLLVRARQKRWYFTTDYLNTRSFITTLLIVICATLIAGGAGIVKGKYTFSLQTLIHPDFSAILESFLFGMASLVLSSTLLATVLTKDADLPGLPSSDFVTALGKIRQQLIAIRLNQIFREFSESIDFDDLKSQTDLLIKEIEVALSQPGHELAKRPLRPLGTTLGSFSNLVITIKNGGSEQEFRWQARFADLDKIADPTRQHVAAARESIVAECSVIQEIISLRLGG